MGTGDLKYRILGGFNTGWFFADDILLTSDEALEQDRVRSRLPGSKYVKGFNVSMGDPDPFFGILQTGKTIQEQSYVDGGWRQGEGEGKGCRRQGLVEEGMGDLDATSSRESVFICMITLFCCVPKDHFKKAE